MWKRDAEGQNQRGNVRKSHLAIGGLEDGGSGNMPRNSGSLWKLGKARMCILLRERREEG